MRGTSGSRGRDGARPFHMVGCAAEGTAEEGEKSGIDVGRGRRISGEEG